MEGLEWIAAGTEEFFDARMGTEGHLAQHHGPAAPGAAECVGVVSLRALRPAQKGKRCFGGRSLGRRIDVGDVVAEDVAGELLVAALERVAKRPL